MISLKGKEKILLRRKVNIRSGKSRGIGTLFITNKRLSFQPLARKKCIDIEIDSITEIKIVGRIFKKMSISTDKREYILFLNGAGNVISLLKALKEKIRA
ncbi:MAG: hypothetical protein U9O96_07855 [Candidatus Thermoplasmatota archaeon]|nr:hypothetical protein [Candidatus Thermoplasmatota archaeon]